MSRSTRPVVLELRLPLLFQFEGRVQQAMKRAQSRIDELGLSDEQCAEIVNAWASDGRPLGRFLRYRAAELQVIEGRLKAFKQLDGPTFALISAVLLLSLAPILDDPNVRRDDRQYAYWLLWAFRFAVNAELAEDVHGRRKQIQAARANAAKDRLDWTAIDSIRECLQCAGMQPRNLASAIVKKAQQQGISVSAKAVRERYGLGGKKGN